jgi:hypothetical protein
MYKYRRIRLSGKSTKDEHRIIMEQHLGRKLCKDEVIHHINGNGKDNRIENLQLMTRSGHTKLHFPNGRPPTEETKRLLSDKYAGKPRVGLAKYSKHQVEEWKLLRNRGVGLRQIARQFGIPHTTIYDAISGKTISYRPEHIDKLQKAI